MLDIVIDQGPRARSVRLQIEPFTLVGATTREGLLAPPFRARFGLFERLEPYDVPDLVHIAKRSAALLKIGHRRRRRRDGRDAGPRNAAPRQPVPAAPARPRAGREEDRRSTSTSRSAASSASASTSAGCARSTASSSRSSRAAGGVPIGLKTLAISVGEDERTIEDVYEPFLIREGYMSKTSRGRVLLPRGEEAAGEPPRPARGRRDTLP